MAIEKVHMYQNTSIMQVDFTLCFTDFSQDPFDSVADPDPGHEHQHQDLMIWLKTKNFQINFLFFAYFVLKLDEPFLNKKIFELSFVNNLDLGFKSRKFFFAVFG